MNLYMYSLKPDSQKDFNCNEAKLFLRDIGEMWIQSKKLQVKESTLNKYLITLTQYICPYLGDITIEAIDRRMVEQYLQLLLTQAGRDQQGLSPKTVADTLSVLNNILKYAEEMGYPTVANACSVRIPKSSNTLQVLSKSEQKKITAYLLNEPGVLNLGILISLFAGLRIGEICALRWENISLSTGTIYVCQTLQRLYVLHDSSDPKQTRDAKTYISISSPKSSSSIRTIPLPKQLTEKLSEYEQETGFFLTGTEHYIEPRSYHNHFKKVLVKCGLKETNYHILRHTFATRCVELGFDSKTLSEILGHASVNITMNRYVHPTMDMKQRDMDRLNELFV